MIHWALLLENTIKYTKSCRIYHQISKYPPSIKYISLFLPCKIIDGRVVTLTKCRYHICATAGVDPEKCILGWAWSLVIFYFTKCLNELPATCLYMRDPMDIFCKKCHIEEVTGLEIQVYSERILFFFSRKIFLWYLLCIPVCLTTPTSRPSFATTNRHVVDIIATDTAVTTCKYLKQWLKLCDTACMSLN